MATLSKKKYNKMDPLKHILHRSDTYVGSTRLRELEDYISLSQENFRIIKKNINYCPAILRIFIEPLSNAIDNVARSQKTKTPCTTIKVKADLKTGETSVWNDGDFIPIEIDEDEKCYNHSLIFGQLLTSSNYDDEEDRYNISGRNGLGSKLVNVFSNYFAVKGLDPVNKKILSQEWTKNMTIANEPVITKTKLKKGYTEVSWIPDFKQFNMTEYSQDIINLYCRYVVDAAMLTGVNVYFNDVLIPVNTVKDYANLYTQVEEKDIIYVNTKDAQVVIMPSTGFQSISFVNGVYTSLGGTHVDAWAEATFRPIVKKLTKTSVTYSIADIKKFFRIFVVVKVINPEFESQSKHKLESPVTATFKKSQTDAMLKWSVIEDIKRLKEFGVLKKLERKKKNFVKIDGLDPANNEGGKLGHQCTLILVEGLAAKTYAVKGIEVGAFGKAGRDWWGIYALRGKVLNVRNAKTASIAKNAVISDIIQALGVKLDADYTDEKLFMTLRYGRILIITDADVDGIHISGLIQNMVHTLFPTLLERSESFITSMQTPIVRVFNPIGKTNELVFYDEREYKKYADDFKQKYPGKPISNKYYKGLGTSSDQDIIDTFGQKMIEFQNDENTTFNMNKIFHTKQADARKKWLENYNCDDVCLAWESDVKEKISLNISDFLNKEMIKFSINDCKRSIPGLMDGLKESHRKTLYACFKRNLNYTKKSLKVAQLSGYVAEHTAYHHGEQNLYETITRMANCYPGSNNIPLLYRDGQFGSRLSGGKDAANARYIFTKLDGMTRYLFNAEDDILLDRVVDDGDVVEPTFYVPILPTVLINGCTVGIGTGWSCCASETPVMLWNGETKRIDCIKIGDKIIGDDGTVRNVLNTCSGEDDMYTITHQWGDSYTVNSKHTLSLAFTGHKSIYYQPSRNCWSCQWWDKETNTSKNKTVKFSTKIITKHHPESKRLKPNKPNHTTSLTIDEAKQQIEKFVQTIPNDDKVDIKISDYMKLPTHTKKDLKGYKGYSVQWEKQDIPIDPYILGMWLGDGNKDGSGFSANPDLDTELIEYWKQWAKKEGLNITEKRKFDYKITDPKSTGNSFKQSLRKLGILNNKHIPKEYLLNDVETRLKVLAGLIDTHGSIGKDDELLFSQGLSCHEILVNDVVLLTRSLGLSVKINDYNSQYTLKSGEKRLSKIRRLRINGNVTEIPILTPRKIPKTNSSRKNYSKIGSVNHIGTGSYTGISIDGNKRFVLGDFTATHNCSVPCYNPLDLIASVKVWMEHDGKVLIKEGDTTISLLPEITPWYRGHTGEIEKSGDSKYTSWGRVIEEKKTKVVDELPIGMWTDNFKEFLEGLQVEKVIKSHKNYSTPKNVRFVIKEENDGIVCNKETLKLHKYIYTSNMVLFDENGCIKKYESTDEIIDSFCHVRLVYYYKRKKHLIDQMERDISMMGNKKRFLEEVMSGDVKLFDDSGPKRKSRKTADIIKELEDRGYDKDTKITQDDDDNDDCEKEVKNGYDYLLRLQFRSITEERINKLKNDIASKIKTRDALAKKTEKNLWTNDLDEFEKSYTKWLKAIEKEVVKKKTK
jgi:DNA topoisomerase-2